jgi:DNA polymerase I-like protein with 3'-5' exonuclease and polymerase domains
MSNAWQGLRVPLPVKVEVGQSWGELVEFID